MFHRRICNGSYSLVFLVIMNNIMQTWFAHFVGLLCLVFGCCVFFKRSPQVEIPLYIIKTIEQPRLERFIIINMGGHGSGPEPLIKDPAFEKFYRFRETAGERFRVTPRNLGPIILLTLVIPAGVTWLAYNSQGNYFRGNKRRTEPIYESEYKLRTK